MVLFRRTLRILRAIGVISLYVHHVSPTRAARLTASVRDEAPNFA